MGEGEEMTTRRNIRVRFGAKNISSQTRHPQQHRSFEGNGAGHAQRNSCMLSGVGAVHKRRLHARVLAGAVISR
jgi:hypothetical protein